MALIDTFKDRFGRFIYPKTVPKAIIDPDTGESLDKFFDREFYEKIGDPAFLETMDKSTLVSAINELKTKDGLHLAETVRQNGGVHGLEAERGDFTPTLTTTNHDGVAVYGNIREGAYVRLGDLVYITLRMTITSFSNATGYYEISGLPFVAGSADRYRYLTAPNTLSSDSFTCSAVLEGLRLRNKGGQAAVPVEKFNITKFLHVSGVYYITN